MYYELVSKHSLLAVITGETYNESVDIFSYGIVLCEVCILSTTQLASYIVEIFI